MHGQNPEFASKSLSRYVLYYAPPVCLAFDRKTDDIIQITREKFQKKFGKYLYTMAVAAILMGIMKHYEYTPFPSRERKTILDFYHWGNLLNSYSLGYLTDLYLSLSASTVGLFIEIFTGVATAEFSNNPLTRCTSLSDFWGRRWNSLIHSVLKGGVYKPMRLVASAGVASIATFVASGLFHEWLLYVYSVKATTNENAPPTPSYGMHMIFFAYNAVAITLEILLRGNPVFRWMSNNLPQPVITFLVIMTVLPVGHWFGDEYINQGLYEDVSLGFPRIHWTPAGY